MLRKAAKLYQRVDKSKFIEHPEYTTGLLCNDMTLITTPVISCSTQAFILSGQQLLQLCRQKTVASGLRFYIAIELDIISVHACPMYYGDVFASSRLSALLCPAAEN